MRVGADGIAGARGNDSVACACPGDGETLAGAGDGAVDLADLPDDCDGSTTDAAGWSTAGTGAEIAELAAPTVREAVSSFGRPKNCCMSRLKLSALSWLACLRLSSTCCSAALATSWRHLSDS